MAAIRQALGVTTSTVQISWDGRIGNTPGEGEYAEPWTYTYDVKVCQEDISEEDFGSEDLNRVCGVGDRYRSEYLTIYRDVDEQGQPIYDAEYYGYDEGDPEDPNDDNYIYLIRRYRLEDCVLMGESKDASEGEVWLYNPDLDKVGTWNITSLECINHDNECDGLVATGEDPDDTRHALLVPVPVSMMDEGGTYIFVLHIKDDHPELYRDHQHRWTLELNSIRKTPAFAVIDECPWGHVIWCPAHTATEQLKHMGYRAYKPEGNPYEGGSGKIRGVKPQFVIHTLNKAYEPGIGYYLDPHVCTKNDVWAYFGHGIGGAIVWWRGWNSDECDGGLYTEDYSVDVAKQHFPLIKEEFPLEHLRLVYLYSCSSCGGLVDGVEIEPQYSIGQWFHSLGAKCVVGFTREIRGNSPIWWYFNKRFWDQLASGLTVAQSLDRAKHISIGRHRFRLYSSVKYIGDGSVRLVDKR